MLSAWVDNELTQGESQRVRIHVESCAECGKEVGELLRLKQLTAEARFTEPPDEALDRIERALSVRGPRNAGWLMLCAGIGAWLLWTGWLFIRDWQTPSPEQLIPAAIVIGVVLLFASVVRERLMELPHDRYRRVRR